MKDHDFIISIVSIKLAFKKRRTGNLILENDVIAALDKELSMDAYFIDYGIVLNELNKLLLLINL